jgi:Haem-degrading
MKILRAAIPASIGLGLTVMAAPAFAGGSSGLCSNLPSWSQLKTQLVKAVSAANGGLGFNMWGVLVATDGTVCAVAFSGSDYTSQWLGSRAIAAQKANTADDFSLSNGGPPGSSLFPTGLALSTANLYSAVQPGGSLYGLQHSNPVDTEVAYDDASGNPAPASQFGTPFDPMVGRRIGGVNVFGGGLGAYQNGIKIGGIGVSGDTSCTDHNVAWNLRHNLKLDGLNPVKGVSGDTTRPDNIIFDIAPNIYGGSGISTGGFGHPICINYEPTGGPPYSANLPVVH